jgi:hypothetical protein
MTIAEWQLVVTAIVGAFVAWQAWETRKAAEAAHLSAGAAKLTADAVMLTERAYVDMSHDQPGFVTMEGATGVSVAIKNHGKTPATVTAVNLTFLQHGWPLPPTPEYNENLTVRTRTVVMPGERFTHERRHALIGSGQSALPESVATPGLQGVHAWLIGYVDYRDRFGGRHRGGYGRRYRPNPGNNLVFIDEDDYNYDRPREKSQGNDWNDPDE